MSPCGKIVDYLRSCYSTKFRFFPDDLTRESEVTWYRPAPGAQLLGYYNRFSSSVYSKPMSPAEDPQVGEIIGEPHVWYNGAALSSFPGDHSCTNAIKWVEGSPGPGADFDETTCCTVPAVCAGALLCDTFTDTTGTPLTAHPMDVGPGWAVGQDGGGETWSIQTGKAKVDYALTNLGNACCISDAGSANGTMTFDISLPATGNWQGFAFWRFQDVNNHYLLVWGYFTGAANPRVYEVKAGVFTQKGIAAVTRPAAGSYPILVVLSGNSHLVKANGVTIANFNDSFQNTKTKWGMGQFLHHGALFDFVSSFDNFKVMP